MADNYIIEAYEFIEDGQPIERLYTHYQENAVTIAEKLSLKYPQVYVSFTRGSDGQYGFINRYEGASFEQKNWSDDCPF